MGKKRSIKETILLYFLMVLSILCIIVGFSDELLDKICELLIGQ